MEDMIRLPHRPAIDRLRKLAGNELSAYGFQSLFLWQKQMDLHLILQENAFTLRCGSEGYFFPCGQHEAVLSLTDQLSLAPGQSFLYLRDEDVALLRQARPGLYQFARWPEADEYLYAIPGHAAMTGKDYANMRTQVHKIEKRQHAATQFLSDSNLPHALDVIAKWAGGADRFAGAALRDDDVDALALRMHRELEVTGVIVYLDDRPCAVAAGFPLTEDIFDMVVAKCTENIPGLSYYAKRELMLCLQGRYTFLNLEEDLGLPGLRHMKQGMHPVAMNNLWKAVKA